MRRSTTRNSLPGEQRRYGVLPCRVEGALVFAKICGDDQMRTAYFNSSGSGSQVPRQECNESDSMMHPHVNAGRPGLTSRWTHPDWSGSPLWEQAPWRLRATYQGREGTLPVVYHVSGSGG